MVKVDKVTLFEAMINIVDTIINVEVNISYIVNKDEVKVYGNVYHLMIVKEKVV